MLPLYSLEIGECPARGDGHSGLWHERFFNGYVGWKRPTSKVEKEDWADKKIKWLEAMATPSCGEHAACESATRRLAELCKGLGGQIRVYECTWHMVTGLGNPHPLENGFAWHPTLATPYLAGSAVKGLVRAWVESWMEFSDPDANMQKLNRLYRWFGSEHKDPKERKKLRDTGFVPPSALAKPDTEAGCFIFFDAIPVKPVRLKADVMTPHMGDWYEKGGQIGSLSESDRVPADWHDPVPVGFLVAHKPRLQFAIAPRTAAAKDELNELMDALGMALEFLGAGAKTAVGYGAMNRQKSAEAEINQRFSARDEAKRQAAELQARRAQLSPLQRTISDYLDARIDKHQSDISALINALKTDCWQGAEREQVLRHLQLLMRDKSGQWKQASAAKRPERDKEYQNTLLVQSWLNAYSN